MSARIPPGFAEAWLRFDVAGDSEPMYMSLGIDLAPGSSGTVAITDSIIDTFQDAVRPVLSSDYTVGGGHVIYGQDGGDIRIDATIAPQAGTAGAAGLPNNTAVLIQKRTALGGRRNRGRMFQPGLTEPDASPAGAIGAAYLAAAQTAYDNVRTNLVALADVDALALFHSSAPFTPTTITDLEVSNKAATQRRRMRP